MDRIAVMNGKIKKKSTILALNDDCLRKVMLKLNREELSTLCSINNSRVRNVGERIFVRSFGKCLTILKDVLSTEEKTCKAFGDVFNKFIIEFRPNEIARMLKFVEKHFVSDVEQLEICHLSDGNRGRARRFLDWCSEKIYERVGKSGDQKLQTFFEGLDQRFLNLVHLKFDFREEQPRSYLKYIPFMPNLEVITITGWVDQLEVIFIQYELSKHGYWWRRHETPLGVLLVKSLDKILA